MVQPRTFQRVLTKMVRTKPDGRQSQVTASGALAPLFFQLIEEGTDQAEC
jgi:hypothetical protein